MGSHHITLLAAFAVLVFSPTAARADAEAVERWCTQAETCGDDEAATCAQRMRERSAVAGVAHDTCQQLLAALDARYACRALLACDAFDDVTACAEEANAVADLSIAGGHNCFSGRTPVVVPETWTCNTFYYAGGAGDGCDCGCGEVDPDCEVGGCGENGCTAEGCDYCYTDNADLGCDVGEGEGEGEGEPDVSTPDPNTPSSTCSTTAQAGSLFAAVALMLARRSRRPLRR
jgi:hypothetical protein